MEVYKVNVKILCGTPVPFPQVNQGEPLSKGCTEGGETEF